MEFRCTFLKKPTKCHKIHIGLAANLEGKFQNFGFQGKQRTSYYMEWNKDATYGLDFSKKEPTPTHNCIGPFYRKSNLSQVTIID